MITCTGTELGAHVAHARGVSAILTSKCSPFDLLCEGKLFQLASPLPLEILEKSVPKYVPTSYLQPSKKLSVLCTPIRNMSAPTLDEIFVKMHPLIRRSEALVVDEGITIEDLQFLKQETEQLKRDYVTWKTNMPEAWRPKVDGIIPDTSTTTR